eukprot:scaffold204512_cov17-Tisochrysis_lutea.AAC.1
MDLPGVENPALAAGHHQGQPQCMALLDRSVTRTSPGTALPQDILSRFKSATTARSRRLLPYVLQDRQPLARLASLTAAIFFTQ